MNDLTKITTPLALLDDETREALKAHGGPYEHWRDISAKWEAIEFQVWNPGIIYRVTPNTKDSINWDHVADEFICMARDESGTCHLYTKTPQIHLYEWDDDTMLLFQANGLASYKRGTCDWKDSLVFRPGHEPKGEQNDD